LGYRDNINGLPPSSKNEAYLEGYRSCSRDILEAIENFKSKKHNSFMCEQLGKWRKEHFSEHNNHADKMLKQWKQYLNDHFAEIEAEWYKILEEYGLG
jgi:hypothetical protein